MSYIHSVKQEIDSVLESIFIDIEPFMDELADASHRQAWSDSLNAVCDHLEELKKILAMNRLRLVH